jgi:hypothetical protein
MQKNFALDNASLKSAGTNIRLNPHFGRWYGRLRPLRVSETDTLHHLTIYRLNPGYRGWDGLNNLMFLIAGDSRRWV